MTNEIRRKRLDNWLGSHKIISLSVLFSLLTALIVISMCIPESVTADMRIEDFKIRINEVMSKNDDTVSAKCGKCTDWVEIYNYGTTDVPLSLLRFSRSEQTEFSSLPNTILKPGDYTAVLFTDKDIPLESDEPIVYCTLPASGTDIHLSTVFGNVLETLSVPELDGNMSWGVIDDEGGTLSYGFFASPSPGERNSGFARMTYDEMQNIRYDLEISECLPECQKTSAEAANYIPFAEIYNPTNQPIELRGCSLSDDEYKNKFIFPTYTLFPGEYAVICSGEEALISGSDMYLGFQLTEKDDALYFRAPDNTLIDLLPLNSNSLGYSLVKSSDKIKYALPSPGKPSDTLYESAEKLARRTHKGIVINEVMAVHDDGAYDWIELYNSSNSAVSVFGWTLSDGGSEIYTVPDRTIMSDEYYVIECSTGFSINKHGEALYLYDTDKTLQDTFDSGKQRLGISSGRNSAFERVYFANPTKGSKNSGKFYYGYLEAPLLSNRELYAAAGDTVAISCDASCIIRYTTNGSEPTESSPVYFEPIKLNSSCVIRAKAFPTNDLRQTMLESDEVSATYIVGDSYTRHSLPVISVSAEPSSLFGSSGAYTRYENDYRPFVHFEYYDKNGCRILSTDTLFHVAGNTSRAYPQKSFSLNFSERVGDSKVTSALFRDSNRIEFPNLLLRACGQEWNKSKLRDEYTARALKGSVNCLVQAAEPCVVYINGNYYGLYYLREKRNEKFIASYTEYDADEIFISESYLKGAEYKELEEYAQSRSMTDPICYKYMEERVDFDSLIDFWIAESYFSNPDTHNTCRWKASDGKWQFIYYDMDYAFTTKYMYSNFIGRLYSGADNDREGYLGAVYCPIMTALLKNPDFEKRFVERYCELLAATLCTDRMLGIFDEMTAEIEAEIPNQYKRWHAPSTTAWLANVKEIRSLIETREGEIIDQLAKYSSFSKAEIRSLIKKHKK